MAYIVLAPDKDSLMTEVRTFVKVLSNGYESLKLGRHASGAKSLCDGVLKVGPKMAGKLEAEPVTNARFSAIGDCTSIPSCCGSTARWGRSGVFFFFFYWRGRIIL